MKLSLNSQTLLFVSRLERKRQQILKEMAKLENLDSGDGGGDSDTGSKDGGKESGRDSEFIGLQVDVLMQVWVTEFWLSS